MIRNHQKEIIQMRRTFALVAATAAAMLATACSVEQTKEAEAPDVDVNASGGQLPEFDVDAKEVVVGTTEENVEVPDVDVKTKETTVEVPKIEVKD